MICTKRGKVRGALAKQICQDYFIFEKITKYYAHEIEFIASDSEIMGIFLWQIIIKKSVSELKLLRLKKYLALRNYCLQ